MGRMGYDTLEDRAVDFLPLAEPGAPASLIAALREGDVPDAALALRAHHRAGGWLHDCVRDALRLADKSGNYADDQTLVAIARKAFAVGSRR
jgi:hypothetical protein